MIKIMERKEPGVMVRPYHGIAYYDSTSNITVTAIVPLNWIISITRAIWAFIRFGNRHIAENSRAAYLQGHAEGRRNRP